MKASHKQLKASLAPGVKKLDAASVTPKLGEFPLFDKFFLDLVKFQDLDNFFNFPPFDFPDFVASSSLSLLIPNLTILPLPFSTSGPDMSGDPVVFNIEVSGAAILLKPWMNCQ